MTQVATPATVQADFSSTRIVDVQGQPMLLERRGDEFWARVSTTQTEIHSATDRCGSPGRWLIDHPASSSSAGVLVSHWRAAAVVAHQIPSTYYSVAGGAASYAADGGVFFDRLSRDRPPSATGNWNVICMQLSRHTWQGEGRTANHPHSRFDRRRVWDRLRGLSAGPGNHHVDVNRNPLCRDLAHLTGQHDPYDAAAERRFEPRAAAQARGQCHGVFGYADTEDEQSLNVMGHPYRPGQDLLATRFLVHPSQNTASPRLREFAAKNQTFMRGTFWSDGMVRVSGREYNGLIDSPCYVRAPSSDRTLTCFSCHSMHKEAGDRRTVSAWADTHQVSPGMESNQACLSCHGKFRSDLPAHTNHRDGSSAAVATTATCLIRRTAC